MAVNYAQALGLGGLNPTAIAQQTQIGQQQIQQNQNVLQQQQAEMERQAKIQELAPLAAQGDANALNELMGYAPELQQGIQARFDKISQTQGAQAAQQSREATTRFFQQYKAATPEQRIEMTRAAEANPMIDFDAEDYQAIEQSGDDLIIDTALFNLMGKDGYSAIYGGQGAAKYENVKVGEDGRAYGINTATGQYEQVKGDYAPLKSSGQTINVNTGQKSQERIIGEFEGQSYVDTQKQAQSARSQMANLNTLERLSDKAFSGTGAGAFKFFAKLADQIGMDIEGLSESEVFNAVASSLTLDKAGQMSGALSDKDIAFLKETVPALSQTPEGRKRLIKIMKATNQRLIDYGKEAAKYRKERGGQFDPYEFQQYMEEKNAGADFLSDFYPDEQGGGFFSPALGRNANEDDIKAAMAKGYTREEVLKKLGVQ